MRSGILAKKVGMTRLFMEDGKQIPVTVLQLDGLQVVGSAPRTKTATPPFTLGAGSSQGETRLQGDARSLSRLRKWNPSGSSLSSA